MADGSLLAMFFNPTLNKVADYIVWEQLQNNNRASPVEQVELEG
jgi:hypothetical protein